MYRLLFDVVPPTLVLSIQTEETGVAFIASSSNRPQKQKVPKLWMFGNNALLI